MFSQLLAPLQAKVNLALISAVCYAAAGIAGAIAGVRHRGAVHLAR